MKKRTVKIIAAVLVVLALAIGGYARQRVSLLLGPCYPVLQRGGQDPGDPLPGQHQKLWREFEICRLKVARKNALDFYIVSKAGLAVYRQLKAMGDK